MHGASHSWGLPAVTAPSDQVLPRATMDDPRHDQGDAMCEPGWAQVHARRRQCQGAMMMMDSLVV